MPFILSMIWNSSYTLALNCLEVRLKDLLCSRIIKWSDENKHSFMKRSEKLQQVRHIWGQAEMRWFTASYCQTKLSYIHENNSSFHFTSSPHIKALSIQEFPGDSWIKETGRVISVFFKVVYNWIRITFCPCLDVISSLLLHDSEERGGKKMTCR